MAQRTYGGSWRAPDKACRGVLQLPVHKFGVLRYPYFSTPTGAPGSGPHTVPSVVGPGPNGARVRARFGARRSFNFALSHVHSACHALGAASWGSWAISL